MTRTNLAVSITTAALIFKGRESAKHLTAEYVKKFGQVSLLPALNTKKAPGFLPEGCILSACMLFSETFPTT